MRLIITVLIVILAVAGCEDPLTSHPDDGGIVLSIDWSGVKTSSALPACTARVIYPSGEIQDFTDIKNDGYNELIVTPGDAMLYVFSASGNIAVEGAKATLKSGVSTAIDELYAWSSSISTEKDRDLSLTAVMKPMAGNLKLSVALTPPEIVSDIKSVSASMGGVYSQLDIQDGSLSDVSEKTAALSVGRFYATANIPLLGLDYTTKKDIKIGIELANNRTINVSGDATSCLSWFSPSKNEPFNLNATLNISPDFHATLSEWDNNAEVRYLSVSPSEIELTDEDSEQSLTVVTDQPSWQYNITQTGSWLTATQSGEKLTLRAEANNEDFLREATVTVTASGAVQNVIITQESAADGDYADKKVVRLQKATVGKGVNVIFMGDGYTLKHMAKKTGKYERDMRTGMEAFFSTYPYDKYRNYFNVWMVTAISAEEGVSIESQGKKVNTKFKATWTGTNPGISCDENTVVEYVGAIEELLDMHIENFTVVLPVNTTVYAGETHMDDGSYIETHSHSQGFSICMMSVDDTYEPTVVHECGHGFAKLIDEYYQGYAYYPNETIPTLLKLYLVSRKPWGWWENIDFYADIMQTSWKGFANNPKYSMVGTFEGACRYGYGIWRPEYNSCMNNSVLYFNAPSRWAIVRRIMYLAGIDYSFEQFLQDDVVPAYPTSTRSSSVDKPFVPLAPPVLKAIKDTRKRK